MRRTVAPLRRGGPALALAFALGLAGCSHIVVLHDPLTAAEHNDLGVSYEAQGERTLAAREYRRALHCDPRYGRARVNLGNVEAAAGRWTRAARCYARAMRDLPDDPDPCNNLAVALTRLGRDLERAERLAERAVGMAAGHDSLYRATLAEVREARATAAPRSAR